MEIRIKHYLFFLVLALTAHVPQAATIQPSTESVVRRLYQQIVKRRPLGIPKGADKAAINPFLSRGLVQTLETAQACQDDYFRQHPEKDSKPAFPWLESGLFSGANEKAIPSAAEIVKTEQQSDGSSRVFVRLTYKESLKTYTKQPDPTNTFHWQAVALVKSENGRFVVDDVLVFAETSKNAESRLSDSFKGCSGPHWVGEKN